MTLTQLAKLTRPRTLTAAFSPVFLGATFSYTFYPSVRPITESILYSLLILITVMGAQIAANIWNEYFDYISGLDKTQVIGNSGSITRDNISPRTIKQLGYVFTTLALLAGLSLSYHISWSLVLIGFVCVSISILYSAGPLPLSRTPFGDLASGLAMGFAIVYITCFVWTLQYDWFMLLPALPSLVLVGSILMANNIRDLENDQQHGRHTLAIHLGRQGAINFLRSALTACFLWICFWIFTGHLPLTSLLALFASLPASKAIQQMNRFHDVRGLDKAMAYVAMSTTLYHILFGLGLLLSLR